MSCPLKMHNVFINYVYCIICRLSLQNKTISDQIKQVQGHGVHRKIHLCNVVKCYLLKIAIKYRWQESIYSDESLKYISKPYFPPVSHRQHSWMVQATKVHFCFTSNQNATYFTWIKMTRHIDAMSASKLNGIFCWVREIFLE